LSSWLHWLVTKLQFGIAFVSETLFLRVGKQSLRCKWIPKLEFENHVETRQKERYNPIQSECLVINHHADASAVGD
jgi:hypothetical protein